MSASPDAKLTAPLRIPEFRRIWSANIVSNIGTLMQGVGAAWLMTSLTTSTTLVGLVQTASTLPVFLVGLLAGALATAIALVGRHYVPAGAALPLHVATLAAVLAVYGGALFAWQRSTGETLKLIGFRVA